MAHNGYRLAFVMVRCVTYMTDSFVYRFGYGTVHAKMCSISNRNLEKAAKLYAFSRCGKMQHAPSIFLEWVDFVVFDESQQVSNWNCMFILCN